MINALFGGDSTDLKQAPVIPFGVVSPEFDLQAGQPVPSDPLPQVNRIPIVRFVSPEFRGIEGIQSSDQMPNGKAFGKICKKIIRGISPREAYLRILRGFKVASEVMGKALTVITGVGGSDQRLSEGIMQGEVDG
tara:strand:+ start:1082 stop:1486 length:405 start_codon:yes stop_codon:yes gene_type:complete